jgi:hemerythrin-like domain-containing protein
MDAIELLKADHREVEELLNRIADLEEDDAEERGELFEQVKAKLKAHETIEQEIFYPAAKEAGEEAEEIVSHSYVEHHLVDVLIDEIGEVSPGDEEWTAKTHVLKELVMHHVEEEQDELFPAARNELEKERLEQLGEEMQARKDEMLGAAVGAETGSTGSRARKPKASGRKAKPKSKSRRSGRGKR